MKEKLLQIEITDANDILDRIIGFINNCDNKASIILGFYGVIISILISKISIKNIKLIFSLLEKGYRILFFIVIIILIIVFIIGIIKLFLVLFPKLNFSKMNKEERTMDSKIYFGSISRNLRYRDYRNKLGIYSKDEYLEDIISQIYLNSLICNKKFINYRIGFLLTSLSLSILVLLYLILDILCLWN